METLPILMEYLAERGAPYHITAQELYDAIPAEAQEPSVAYQFMKLKDISHIEPLSKGGETAGDNWFLEDSSVNRARGAETATDQEQREAAADAKADARALRSAAIGGGSILAGGVLLDAVTAAAAGTAVVSAEAALATVAVPLICIGGAVMGILALTSSKPKKRTRAR